MCLPYFPHHVYRDKKITPTLLTTADWHAGATHIKGSDTVLPIAQRTAERFMTLTPLPVSP